MAEYVTREEWEEFKKESEEAIYALSGNLQALWYCWAISLDLESDDYKPMMNALDEAISDPDQAMDVDHPVSVEVFHGNPERCEKGYPQEQKSLRGYGRRRTGILRKTVWVRKSELGSTLTGLLT